MFLRFAVKTIKQRLTILYVTENHRKEQIMTRWSCGIFSLSDMQSMKYWDFGRSYTTSADITVGKYEFVVK